jgi:hypothetical protein
VSGFLLNESFLFEFVLTVGRNSTALDGFFIIFKVDFLIVVIVFLKGLAIGKKEESRPMLRSLNKGSLIESGIFPCILALSFELVSDIRTLVGVAVLKKFKALAMLVPIIKLALIISILVLVVYKLS